MGPGTSGRFVLLQLIAVRKREDLVLDHQGRSIRPVKDEVHVAVLAIDPPSGIHPQEGQRSEGGIGRLGQHVEEPSDEVAVEQLSLAIHESPERVALDAPGDLSEVV